MRRFVKAAGMARRRVALALGLLLIAAVYGAGCALLPSSLPTPGALPTETPWRHTATPLPATATLDAQPTAPPSVATASRTPLTIPTPTSTAAPLATATPLPPTATPLPPTATPPPPDPVCRTTRGRLNLYAGPGASYALLLTLGIDEEVRPIARNAQASWIQVITLDGIQGWLALDFAACQFLDIGRLLIVSVEPPPTPVQPTATPLPPTATPVPTPLIITDWQGEYFSNPSLAGAPALVRNDVAVSFDWGGSAPGPGIPADSFSVRWTRSASFAAGAYRFYVRLDDGARLFVDDALVLDSWQLGSQRTLSVAVTLAAGSHRLRLEYFEDSGDATCTLWWEIAQISNWRGEYFTNPNLGGSPFVIRDDPAISFNWGTGSPYPGIPSDNFSVRWTRDMAFDGGVYRFRVTVDDGVRLWIDGNIVIDEWRLATGEYTKDVTLTNGRHSLRLEYFENTGGALITLNWDRLPDGFPNYRGDYFNNETLLGSPVLSRNDLVLDFIWGQGSPDSRINAASFSARWTGRPDIVKGTYRLRAESDDGVRVWIDGVLLVDQWQLGEVIASVDMTINQSGPHDVRVEYFQHGGAARIHVWWIPVRGAVAQ